MLRENPPPRQKSWVGPTYRVTIIMLVIGQIQVSVAMEITPLKEFLADRYYLSLVQFVVSFLSIQLYGFFYHIIVKKPMWVRLLAGLWTYEVNTMSIMKPAKRAPYISLILSIFLTFLMMIISVIYGNSAIKHKKGLFTTRHKVILWSERIFVLTCFGIIVCAEMKRVIIEFPTLLVYTILSSVVSLGETNRYTYFPRVLGASFQSGLSWSLPLPCESRTSTARSRPGTTY
ncbi:uncharacterized protein LOC6733836 isoform X2 [Drosophila simulans]|uniref:Uncharacterized protein, isoform D n=1 Tax=Drosophila simulans TaxID=7240 RepID=A0A0J9RAL0_DROSI|nr:uncharacterized protein LOC6733836 isoform X2 [Drosophila simulans]KMY92739.1 uncharacterized protein Dsimw501_GD10723, isoform D [Drosophila simulans]